MKHIAKERGKWKEEKDLQKDFTAWLRRGGGYKIMQDFLGVGSYAYELKLVKFWRGGNIRGLTFKKLPEHQMRSLSRAAGLLGVDCPLDHKISDAAIGFKPCDGFVVGGGWGEGVVVIGFDSGPDDYQVLAVKIGVLLWYMERRGGRGSWKPDWILNEGKGIMLWSSKKDTP